MSIILAIAILLIYALTHFVFDARIDALGPYASYVGEGALIVMALAVYRKKFRFSPRSTQRPLLQAAVSFVLGFVVYRAGPLFHSQVPFDFRVSNLVALLLVLGPLVEELLFRFALWCPLERLTGERAWVALLATTLLFSLGHFQAWFYVPAPVKNFVLYQTAYTFLLGLWWGLVYLRTRAIGATLALHFLFNLGFYAGFSTWIAGY